MRSLHIGATGMLAQQTNVEIISNNIANDDQCMVATLFANQMQLTNDAFQRIGNFGDQANVGIVINDP